MKKIITLLLFFAFSLPFFSQAQDSTAVAANSTNVTFLDFVKKVYFNPTILIKTQNFKNAHQVQIQILPSNSDQSPQSIKGFEKAMQKIIRFLISSGNEGIVRFYFNPNHPQNPFSFVASEELHCKFSTTDIDSITTRLNKAFKTNAIDYNNSALFEGAIQAGLDYTSTCLNKNRGKCGPKTDNEIKEINTKPLYTTIHRGAGSKYDIDTMQFDAYSSYYTEVYDLHRQKNVFVPAKLFIAGESAEPLTIAIHKREPLILKQNFKVVYMATKQVMELEASSTIDSLKIVLPANLPANQVAEYGIYYKSTVDSLEYLVGSFSVHVYTEKKINLHLVSVDNAPIDEAQILSSLQKIYGPVGVKFTIQPSKNIAPEASWATSITMDNSSLLSSYTQELRDYVGAVKNLNDYSKNDYFLVLGLNSESNYSGYMPRKSNIGFIFSNATNKGDVIAHEIGHGAFHLRHIFDEEELGENAKGTTKNLMDYVVNPLDLYTSQWEGIDDPVAVGWFEGDDEDGAYRKPKCITTFNLTGDFCIKDMICALRPYFAYAKKNPLSNNLRSQDSIVFNIYDDNTLANKNSVYIWKYGGSNSNWTYSHLNVDKITNKLINKGTSTFSFREQFISACDNRITSYCEDTIIIPPKAPIVFDYLIYVAYPMAWAAPGIKDNHPSVVLFRIFMGGNTSLQVGHTGFCLVKCDTVSKRAKIDYYDFGRFNKQQADLGNGIRRYFDLGYLNISIDTKDTTYKITHTDSIDILINKIPYFNGRQKDYGRKEISIVPIFDYNFQNAKNIAISNFYQICPFGFGDNNSFCTDYVHDIFTAGGISMVDISTRLDGSKFKNDFRKWLQDHDKDTELMKYWDQGDIFLTNDEKSPLPINFAIKLKTLYPKFN